ncbi:dnaJ-like protein 60 [Tribolium madens]|uniref:dnaJ-like protein 60 n=1 Tax=Tribolium madens TaxID=41895 RepID=UPI001CF759CE|nr:dnaJ-like protein 60 [Tribolium madens]
MLCKICSDFSKLTQKTITLHNSCRFYQTHYDVLNLSRNCTDKEIRSAFIKLSKEHHPDVNKSEQSHARFQKINEAYKVLGKRESRRNYDLGLTSPENHTRRNYNETYYEQPTRNPYNDPMFWVNRNKSRDKYYENRSYYGVDGIPKLPNSTVVIICIFFSLIGVGLQYLAITRSVTFKREVLILKSLEAEKVHNETRTAANDNGNEVQLEALKKRLLGKAMKETDNK